MLINAPSRLASREIELPEERINHVRHSMSVIPAKGEREAKEVLDEAKAVALAESTLRRA
jgi:hypothetical protein